MDGWGVAASDWGDLANSYPSMPEGAAFGSGSSKGARKKQHRLQHELEELVQGVVQLKPRKRLRLGQEFTFASPFYVHHAPRSHVVMRLAFMTVAVGRCSVAYTPLRRLVRCRVAPGKKHPVVHFVRKPSGPTSG